MSKRLRDVEVLSDAAATALLGLSEDDASDEQTLEELTAESASS